MIYEKSMYKLLFLLLPCFLWADLVLYYSHSCPHSRRVLSYLKDHPKAVKLKDVYADPENKEELRTFGGKMQVPCLLIDGKPLYDDDAIIEWLSKN